MATTRRVPELTLAGAQTAVEAALARAKELGVEVVVAATDRAGRLLAFARMDGAFVLSIEVAVKKAKTVCLAAGAATAGLWEVFGNDPELLHGLAPKLDDVVPVGGGVPITVDGELAGAVGVSGATAAQDADIAAAGAAAVSD
ncbi:MAG TPA: heme-binding protein [Actinobacteria bacterium]|nr:heme-binding protein [Actinomycetota bacterium]